MFDIPHLKRLAIACALAAGAFFGLASTPALAIDTITCTGTQHQTNNPPITATPATTTFHAEGQFPICISTAPGINSGTRDDTGTAIRSCLTLLGEGGGTSTIHWNNGQSSTASVNYTTNVVGAAYIVVESGTVTDGPFTGRSFVLQLTAPALPITLCTLGLGTVSSLDFVAVLEIL